MYIEPNTTIKILKNVPLDKTYKHTLFFESKTAQSNYFSSLTKYNLDNQTYQRVQKGIARVHYKAEDLYDCNYIMFQNTNFGSKWFYGFITSVEYINNVVSEIRFELDVMQTWYFDYNLKECFVEREHSKTDKIGDNIISEPVSCGEYVYSGYSELTAMNDMCVILAIVDVDKEIVDGELYDGIYGGAEMWAYKSTDVQSINNKISSYISAPDSVVSIYMCPSILIPEIKDGGELLPYGAGGSSKYVSVDAITENDKFGSYKPKNKKLYTYPYNYFNLDNGSGSSLPLRYEFFDDLKPVIAIKGVITQPVKVVARPCSYKGIKGYNEVSGYTSLKTESITLESYPMCSWNTNAYASWVAQNSVPLALNTISSVAGIASSMATTNIVASLSAHPNAVEQMGDINVGTNLISNIAGTLSSVYSASISADICRGTMNNGGANVANGEQQFYKSRVHITEQFAKMVDDFFTMFGYATNRVKIPNISNRPHWNYIKTNGCTAIGSIPSDDMRSICSIYDSGITFWKNGDEIGNYSLDNSPK